MKMICATKKPSFCELVACWFQCALYSAGVASLAFVAYGLLSAEYVQHNSKLMLQTQLSTKPVAQPGISESLLHEGDMVGRMDVTRLGISVIILQGSSADTLRHGIGHIVGTPLPGEVGNSTLAGHRDTYFRQLRNIQPTDNIQIQTSSREYIYTVDWTKVVSPDETSVLKPSQDARSTLTLVTCYPFYYIGPAPKRFIVHARLDAVQERQ